MKYYTETTRDLLIDRLLREMEERGEPLPESRPAEAEAENAEG